MKELDIFVEIIDNYGDIGVIYRLAKEIFNKKNGKIKIRVFINQTEELVKISEKAQNIDVQNINGIEYITWKYLKNSSITPSNVIIEAFGCKIPEEFLQQALVTSSLLINLEYFSCEEWTASFHGQESLIDSKQLKKFFFIPSLLKGTGGVICGSKESENIKQLSLNDYIPHLTEEFLLNKNVGTIFSYEKNFSALLEELEKQKKETILLIMDKLSQESFNLIFDKNKYKKTSIYMFPFVSQEEYDQILKLTDFNFVRGEDSFVRALLSGVPFLWHCYFQEDELHLEKIKSFLESFKEYFSMEHSGKYLEELNILSEIFILYNNRKENSLELPKENYQNFFNSLTKLRVISKIYKDHLLLNCNLVNNLFFFIEDKLSKTK